MSNGYLKGVAALWKKSPRLVAAVLVLSLLAAVHVGAFRFVGGIAGIGGVVAANNAYLEAARQESEHDLVMLAEMLAVLDVADSIRVGFDFVASANVEIGQALASMTRLTERGVDAAIAAGAATWVLEGLNRAADDLGRVLLEAALLLLAAYLGLSAVRPGSRDTRILHSLVEIGFVFFLAFYIVVPYSIHGTGWIATRVLDTAYQQPREQLTHMHEEITKTTLDKSPDVLESWTHHERIKHTFETLHKDSSKKVAVLGRYVASKLSAAVVLGLIFPLVIFLVLWLLFRRLVSLAVALLESSGKAAPHAS